VQDPHRRQDPIQRLLQRVAGIWSASGGKIGIVIEERERKEKECVV
jgi:hypothetical protein